MKPAQDGKLVLVPASQPAKQQCICVCVCNQLSEIARGEGYAMTSRDAYNCNTVINMCVEVR